MNVSYVNRNDILDAFELEGSDAFGRFMTGTYVSIVYVNGMIGHCISTGVTLEECVNEFENVRDEDCDNAVFQRIIEL
jgi:hypothetical protein